MVKALKFAATLIVLPGILLWFLVCCRLGRHADGGQGWCLWCGKSL